jgi:nuclear transcription Y subunit beta
MNQGDDEVPVAADVHEADRYLPLANVARIMKNTVPDYALLSKDAKECMVECASEFLSFITSEGIAFYGG